MGGGGREGGVQLQDFELIIHILLRSSIDPKPLRALHGLHPRECRVIVFREGELSVCALLWHREGELTPCCRNSLSCTPHTP